MGLGQKLQFATRRNKTNQIRIRKRELDASNNRSFASEIVSSDYEVTALIERHIKGGQKTIAYKQLGLKMDIETKVIQHVSSPKESDLAT